MTEQVGAIIPGAQELVRRDAQKDGRRIALMQCFDLGAHAQVTCEVYPVGASADKPTSAGPYIFRNAGEALRFVEEATLALSYLGCEIS
jgi:hypothetical protein